MERDTRRFVFVIVFSCLLSGCWRWDFTKTPLYDDIFIRQEIEVDTKNRSPLPENPRNQVNQSQEKDEKKNAK